MYFHFSSIVFFFWFEVKSHRSYTASQCSKEKIFDNHIKYTFLAFVEEKWSRLERTNALEKLNIDGYAPLEDDEKEGWWFVSYNRPRKYYHSPVVNLSLIFCVSAAVETDSVLIFVILLYWTYINIFFWYTTQTSWKLYM